jgi:hypothetical protein
MFFMAYSLQPIVPGDPNYWSGSAPLDLPQLPAYGAGSVALHPAFIRSTEHSVDAIARKYEMTILR